jgi:hypothetical protein
MLAVIEIILKQANEALQIVTLKAKPIAIPQRASAIYGLNLINRQTIPKTIKLNISDIYIFDKNKYAALNI